MRNGAIILLASMLTGCVSAIHWVPDPPAIPTCVPDRPPTWNDFSKQSRPEPQSASTAVSFRLVQAEPARIQAEFDPAQSWVKPDVAAGWHSFLWSPAHQLLRHEQLHFAIGCLLTRQANVSLQTGGDPHAMLRLLQAVVARLNVQYDVETNHGRNPWKQAEWEKAVRSRFKAGLLDSSAHVNLSRPGN